MISPTAPQRAASGADKKRGQPGAEALSRSINVPQRRRVALWQGAGQCARQASDFKGPFHRNLLGNIKREPQGGAQVIREELTLVNRSQSLDHAAGHFPVRFDQGGPNAADRLTSSIGTLLPMELCGRSSL